MSGFKLLNVDSNAKTVKGQARGFMTAVLYLASGDLSGTELCPSADLAGCKAGCLNTAGRGGMAAGNATFAAPNGDTLPDNTVQRARLARTARFNGDRAAFMADLCAEIRRFVRKAERAGLVPVVRLNGTSDIRWEDIPAGDHPHIFAAFSTVQFYDYTKLPNRRRALGIANYSLTFSYSHRAEFAPMVVKALATYGNGVNYAAVFAGRALPDSFLGRDVVNGDESDLRFLDPVGVVVGLTAKGRARRDVSGFVVR